jgi:hypothetical protein
VGLEVRLVEHVHAEAIADVVEVGVGGVVRGADGVDVVALHGHDVGLDGLGRHGLAPAQVVVVAVDALDQHGPAVDEELVAPHLHPAEPDGADDDVDLVALGVEQGDGEVVQGRCLGGPRRHARQPQGQPGAAALEDHPVHVGLGRVLDVDLGLGAVPGDGGPDPPSLWTLPGRDAHRRPQVEVACPGRGVEVGGDHQVGDVGGRGGVAGHAAVHAGVVPVVLVLEVGGVGPPHDGEGQLGRHARLDDAGQVVLLGQAGVLAHAHGTTVDVDVQDGLGSADVQDDALVPPRRRQVERAPVDPGGVRVGHARRRAGERHLEVRVWLAELTLEEKCRLLGGASNWRTEPIERLGIPAVKMSDGPNGVRGEFSGDERTPASVVVPVGIAQGATWDPELIGRVGDLLGLEARRKSAHVLLAPAVNLHRTPVGGRTFEYFSEDPELTAALAVATVRACRPTTWPSPSSTSSPTTPRSSATPST